MLGFLGAQPYENSASLLRPLLAYLFVVVCLSLSGASFICFLGRAWVYSLCAVLCLGQCTQCACNFWASVGKFHESIVAVDIVCVVFGPMVRAAQAQLWRLYFGRARLNSMISLQWLPLSVSSCGICILGDRTFHTFFAAMGQWVSRTAMALSMGLETE